MTGLECRAVIERRRSAVLGVKDRFCREQTLAKIGATAALRTLPTLGFDHAADAKTPCQRSVAFAASQRVSRLRSFEGTRIRDMQTARSLHRGQTDRSRIQRTFCTCSECKWHIDANRVREPQNEPVGGKATLGIGRAVNAEGGQSMVTASQVR